jgi:hypothetical protein
MWGRVKTLVLAAVVASAALVPLFGDPRSTPVTHALWARMLLRSMDMTEAVRASTQASQVFATLAWRDSLSYPADRYLRAEGGVVRREEGGQAVLAAGAGPAEVSYAVAVAQPGDYALRARLSGARAPSLRRRCCRWRGAPRSGVHPQPAPSRAGSSPARPISTRGPTPPSSSCPEGCTLSQVEIAPPCVNSIEPPGGWSRPR